MFQHRPHAGGCVTALTPPALGRQGQNSRRAGDASDQATPPAPRRRWAQGGGSGGADRRRGLSSWREGVPSARTRRRTRGGNRPSSIIGRWLSTSSRSSRKAAAAAAAIWSIWPTGGSAPQRTKRARGTGTRGGECSPAEPAARRLAEASATLPIGRRTRCSRNVAQERDPGGARKSRTPTRTVGETPMILPGGQSRRALDRCRKTGRVACRHLRCEDLLSARRAPVEGSPDGPRACSIQRLTARGHARNDLETRTVLLGDSREQTCAAARPARARRRRDRADRGRLGAGCPGRGSGARPG